MARRNGWLFDHANQRLEFYFTNDSGTEVKVGHLNASGFTVTDGTTTYMTNGVAQTAGIASQYKVQVARLGTTAAVASNGADAILPDTMFVAPVALSVISAWRLNISASDVTKGTATTSASYRRVNLVANVTGSGSGTTIVASQNATASAASLVTRAFATTANNTVPAGAVILASHLSVGAATADGTDMAAAIFEIAYQLV